MNGWTWYAFAGSILAWCGSVIWKRLQKDITGIGNKAREQERKRIQLIAIQIELLAGDPEHVKKLARYLYDSA